MMTSIVSLIRALRFSKNQGESGVLNSPGRTPSVPWEERQECRRSLPESQAGLPTTLILLLIAVALTCPLAPAQMMQSISNARPAAAAGTWTLVQMKYFDSGGIGTGGGTCLSSGTTCQVTVSSVAAGNKLVCAALYFDSATHTFSGCGGGETWTACPAPTCAVKGAGSTGGTDGRYVLSAVGGETQVTCTINSASSPYYGCLFIEYHYTGPSASVDVVGTVNSTCTACTGVALTLAGSNDAIATWGVPDNSFTAITSPYSTHAQFYSGTMEAVSMNTASGAAPTVTHSSSGQVAIASIALKGN